MCNIIFVTDLICAYISKNMKINGKAKEKNMEKNNNLTVKPIMLASVKEFVKKINMMIVCGYEGCGADDGWPR